jgi:hypothetical protein
MPKKFKRYHRFDENGNKIIKRFENDDTPGPEWTHGTGPLKPEHYEKLAAALRKFSSGVPKTEEQKQKMRMAKLGIPKTEEHKQNIRLAAKKKRQAKYQAVMEQLKNND